MGIEFLGNLAGGASANPRSILDATISTANKLPIVGAVLKGKSKSAARISAFQELKRSLNETHKNLLKKSDELDKEAANAQTASSKRLLEQQADAARLEADSYKLDNVFDCYGKRIS